MKDKKRVKTTEPLRKSQPTKPNSKLQKEQEEENKSNFANRQNFCDPLFSIDFLRDMRNLDYYSQKIGTEKNMISPICKESELDRKKKDPFHVLTKSQRVKMSKVRNFNKKILHAAAVSELEERRVAARQKRMEK